MEEIKDGLYLDLVKRGGYINLVAKDINSNTTLNILRISKEGIYRYRFANGGGIKTDGEGRIIILD